ncbi:hypothetical protein RRG08_065545 [Elysia crispata]|uniref:Uncharacterized protein n=1 Tax=Elysia crispata TaxID=231223 RepID=A0AAE1ASV1_9GAST|nr:hypothetical protein RRG08_065545 [Elysia crispata]
MYRGRLARHGDLTSSRQELLDTDICLDDLERKRCPLWRGMKVEDIMQEFYTTRLDYYQRRKILLEGICWGGEAVSKLDNIARFIMERLRGKSSLKTNLRRSSSNLPDQAERAWPAAKSNWKDAQQKNQGRNPSH